MAQHRLALSRAGVLFATVSSLSLAPASAFRFAVDFSTADGKATLAVIFACAFAITSLFATCVYYCTKIDDSLIQERMQQVRAARAARGTSCATPFLSDETASPAPASNAGDRRESLALSGDILSARSPSEHRLHRLGAGAHGAAPAAPAALPGPNVKVPIPLPHHAPLYAAAPPPSSAPPRAQSGLGRTSVSSHSRQPSAAPVFADSYLAGDFGVDGASALGPRRRSAGGMQTYLDGAESGLAPYQQQQQQRQPYAYPTAARAAPREAAAAPPVARAPEDLQYRYSAPRAPVEPPDIYADVTRPASAAPHHRAPPPEQQQRDYYTQQRQPYRAPPAAAPAVRGSAPPGSGRQQHYPPYVPPSQLYTSRNNVNSMI